MYVKNNDFYFDKNDYLHFDKLKFTVHNYNTRRIVSRSYYNYTIDMISLHPDYSIHIDFRKTYKSDDNLKLLFTKDKYRNKMSLLYNLKRAVSSIYNALLLCKQHVFVFYDTLYISIISANKICGNNVNLIDLYKKYMDLHININNPIKQNNTIIMISHSDINNLPDNKIIIENNVVRTKQASIIHPESYNIYYEGTKPNSTCFEYNDDYYIRKSRKNCYISFYTPPSLLAKFIDNIKLFDNIDEVHINNEYDMLKYI